MSVPEVKFDLKQFDSMFVSTVRTNLKFYNKDQINWVKLPEQSVTVLQLYRYGNDSSTVSIDQFCDYFDLNWEDSLEETATRLGHMCASTYNALVGNAMRKFGVGVCITELFENNLKGTVLINDGPSVVDPAGLMRGWASYRFQFGAGTAGK